MITAALVRDALEDASQHAAALILIQRTSEAHIGGRVDVSAAISEWNVPATASIQITSWLAQDPPRFDGKRVPIVVDSASQSLYRTPNTRWERTYTTTAALWGTVIGLGLLIAAFALLNAAHLTTWPSDWVPKLCVLYLCVVAGAALHIGSISLSSIHYDDPLAIYAAARGFDWLRLRWLSIIRLLIPVVVVAGSLWGAGNVPTRFQDLGVALLAGYSADSVFRNSISKISTTAK